MDRTAVQALVDEIGEYEGSDGIESVVSNGYRGELSADVLAECGDPNVARREIESECQARIDHEHPTLPYVLSRVEIKSTAGDGVSCGSNRPHLGFLP